MLLADWQLEGPLLALWPCRRDVWRGVDRQPEFAPAQQQLLQLLRAVQHYHPVYLAVHPLWYGRVARTVSDLPLIPLSYDDAWARDIAPLWMSKHNQLRARAFRFDAWHGLYPEVSRDNAFALRLALQLGLRCDSDGLVIEGGMIVTNGRGLGLIHRRSLLRNNPKLSWGQLSVRLKRQLGLHTLIGLDWAHWADETGGHMDNYAQFIDSNTLAYVQDLAEQELGVIFLAAIQQAFQAQQQPLNLVKLPKLELLSAASYPLVDVQRRKGVLARQHKAILASYANFIRYKDLLVVPQFGLPADATASSCFLQSNAELLQLTTPAREFIAAGGGPHCLTVNLP